MSLSDVVVVMNEGRVEQVGSPVEVYARPVNRFVAGFIGKANFLEGRALDAESIEVAGVRIDVPNGVPHASGTAVTALVRPEALTLHQADGEAGVLRGRVTRASFLGSLGEIVVDVPGQGVWLIDVPNAAEVGLPAVGDEVGVTPSPRSVHVLPE
jgi:ABC-type Fe3+/spermidine/putrescine transport system ATPase subunit